MYLSFFFFLLFSYANFQKCLQYKDLFDNQVGRVKRCELTYDASGNSKGAATVVFRQNGHAALAYSKYNDKLIDKTRRIRVCFLRFSIYLLILD